MQATGFSAPPCTSAVEDWIGKPSGSESETPSSSRYVPSAQLVGKLPAGQLLKRKCYILTKCTPSEEAIRSVLSVLNDESWSFTCEDNRIVVDLSKVPQKIKDEISDTNKYLMDSTIHLTPDKWVRDSVLQNLWGSLKNKHFFLEFTLRVDKNQALFEWLTSPFVGKHIYHDRPLDFTPTVSISAKSNIKNGYPINVLFSAMNNAVYGELACGVDGLVTHSLLTCQAMILASRKRNSALMIHMNPSIVSQENISLLINRFKEIAKSDGDLFNADELKAGSGPTCFFTRIKTAFIKISEKLRMSVTAQLLKELLL